jgi:3-oxoacyl-[acyl-carrier-protein] synthase III
MKFRIEQIEYYLPGHPVSNAALEEKNPEWQMDKVESKTGVYNRHFAAADETAFDLAVKACDKLFISKGIDPKEIDGVIFCTQSPDYIMPSNAFLIHEHFNMRSKSLAFDYNLACSGYVYGLAITSSLLNSGFTKNIILITADTYSRFINPNDRSTMSLFGDAAAVTLLRKDDSGSELIDIIMETSGKDYRSFYIPAGGCRIPFNKETRKEEEDSSGNIRSKEDIYMNGFGVWKFIASVVPGQIEDLLARNNISKNDINCFFFHQASKMTLDSLVKSLDIPPEKVFSNLANIGNTVSASIPIAIKDAMEQGKIHRGDLLLLSGFGVGLSWASALIRF